MLRVVIRQNRTPGNKPFIPDQEVYVHPFRPVVLGGLVKVRFKRYYIPTIVVGMGWEGNEFVLNVL